MRDGITESEKNKTWSKWHKKENFFLLLTCGSRRRVVPETVQESVTHPYSPKINSFVTVGLIEPIRMCLFGKAMLFWGEIVELLYNWLCWIKKEAFYYIKKIFKIILGHIILKNQGFFYLDYGKKTSITILKYLGNFNIKSNAIIDKFPTFSTIAAPQLERSRLMAKRGKTLIFDFLFRFHSLWFFVCCAYCWPTKEEKKNKLIFNLPITISGMFWASRNKAKYVPLHHPKKRKKLQIWP